MPESAPLVDRAWSTLDVKSIDQELRQIEGIASTPTVDHVVHAKASKDGITIKAKRKG